MSTFSAWATTISVFVAILLMPRGVILSLLGFGFVLFVLATIIGLAVIL